MQISKTQKDIRGKCTFKIKNKYLTDFPIYKNYIVFPFNLPLTLIKQHCDFHRVFGFTLLTNHTVCSDRSFSDFHVSALAIGSRYVA